MSFDAANLLFSTNVAQDGKTQYRAACATDFINPFKFYDTFATRDLDGYSMGIPFFPWFPSKGNAQSRADVLAQTDAVRVRSCWGGMVAFEAKWFQSQKKELQGITTTQSSAPATTTTPSTSTTQSIDFHPEVDANLNWHLAPTPLPESGVLPKRSDSLTTPIRFRASPDLFWDASECCLIHADLQDPRGLDSSAPTGIYLNPYIRVAYDTQTLRWLPFTRRFERLYSPIHRILTWMVKLPGYNPRREEEAGQKVTDRVWVYNDEKWMETGNLSGGYRDVERTALPGGFCGSRKLLSFGEGDQRGKWWFEQVPKDELAPRE
ncbi:hypothetical protein M8818_005801 [Zalaria obscura]|uniref:Uncharacterized protein n=1 Tax=Zalaria obscura TaxID=2024903 RepID=A0ACC3S9P3_9PEZI